MDAIDNFEDLSGKTISVLEGAISESLKEASAFGGKICELEGAFGYGRKYE